MKHLEDAIDSQVPEYDDNKMELGDLMNLWHQNLEDADDDIANPQNDIDVGSETSSIGEIVTVEDSDKDLPELVAYKNLISSSPVYEWLLGTIRRKLHLKPAAPNSQDTIRHRILDSLPSSRIVSRYDQPRIYQATFILNWDPIAFVREQEYDQSKPGFIGKIITVTGSSHDAQAMTSLQYLHQTWHSYGASILQLVEATLLNEPGCEYRCIYEFTHAAR
jgi:hypothetical protein